MAVAVIRVNEYLKLIIPIYYLTIGLLHSTLDGGDSQGIFAG
ncbi:hypothetical protein N44_02748 [Microcystis aeruginosa NIES-44]|jgi:hypothetical protein|uniref:Uncharacterized protein n=1 Tax=Microcystis aeruginosa NIES-44 TaxID=449439 RepID=A0A0A1VXE0_MICAE|nr:hypothetical protein N44_02748 [Microcystis aeruginosa NIES-44]